MPIVIRAASTLDASLITRLNRDVQQLHAEFEPATFKQCPDEEALETFFSEKISAPESHIHLANSADKIVGYIWFDVQERSEALFTLPRRRIYVHHLSVIESARRQGVASALFSHMKDHALALGIKDIALDAWATNTSALAFFSAQGFTPFNVSLRRQLL